MALIMLMSLNLNNNSKKKKKKYAYSISYSPLSSSVNLPEILATHIQDHFAQANVGSTNTTGVHAFHALFFSKNY